MHNEKDKMKKMKEFKNENWRVNEAKFQEHLSEEKEIRVLVIKKQRDPAATEHLLRCGQALFRFDSRIVVFTEPSVFFEDLSFSQFSDTFLSDFPLLTSLSF